MGSLDQRAHISIALLVVYPFVFILALILTLWHGFRRQRQAGWFFLVTFALAKIVGAILHIVAEKQTTPRIGLYIAAFAVEGAGLAPLLLCTMSFLGTIGSSLMETHPIFSRRRLRLVHLLITTATALTIVGAVKANDDSESDRSNASRLRKIGGILFMASLVILVLFDLLLWKAQHELTKYQKTLLKGMSIALPFLGIRVLYATLSSFSSLSLSSSTGITSGSSSGLSKFNSISGSWELFLVMDVMMEFIVIAVYIFFGLHLPISKGIDYECGDTSSSPSIPLYPTGTASNYPLNKFNETR